MGSATETARLLAELRRNVRTLQSTNSLSRGSIVNGGSIIAYNAGENPALIVGQQYDGSIIAAPVSGTLPPRPSQPTGEPTLGGARVNWDGLYFGNPMIVAPMDFSRVEIHACPSADYTPETIATLVGTYETPRGGDTLVPIQGTATVWVKLVTRSMSGRRSVSSPGFEVTPQAISDITDVADGDPPAASPDVLLRGGIGSLFASWTAIANHDPVTYEVHLFADDDTTVPVAGDTDTMVAETPATSLAIRQMPDGSTLTYTSIYTAWVIAKDVDGPADPGASSSATMMAITSADIAVDYVYANDVLANQITGGIMNATILIAGLLQTATSGGRTEIGPFGVRIYDANGSDINVDLNGIRNRFRGSIEAIDIIVNDRLQLYGINNYMGIGAKLTMQTKVSAPGQPPGVTFDYEPTLYQYGDPFWFHRNGGWSSADQSNHSEVSTFLGGAQITWNGNSWGIPASVANPSRASFEPVSSTRVWLGSKDYLVLYGYNWDKPLSVYGYPLVSEIRVYDDTALKTGGSVTLLSITEWGGPYLSTRTDALGRCLTGSGGTAMRGDIALVRVDDNTSAKISLFTINPTTFVPVPTVSNYDFTAQAALTAGEVVAGCAYGSSAAMGLAGTNTPVWVMFTNKKNLVIDASSGLRAPSYEWPLPYTDQAIVWSSGDLQNNLHGHFYFANYAGGPTGLEQKAYRYSGSHWLNDETWWTEYAWRGNTASPTLITPPSLKASTLARKMARLNVNVPALPTPQAGVGNARDPAKDVYGWFYYVGKGLTEPGNSSMYKQATQPAGNPTADTSISLASYPTFSGTNPNTVNGFPAANPATIVSSAVDGSGNPLLSIDGNGLIIGKDLLYSGKIESVASDGNGPIVQLQQGAAAGRAGPYRYTAALKPYAGEFGVPTTWAPAMLSGGVAGSGATSTGIYWAMGDWVFFEGTFTLGTGGTCPSGTMFSLPTAPAAALHTFLTEIGVTFLDAGNTFYKGQTYWNTGVIVTGLGTGGVAAAIPFALGVGDQILYGGAYRK